MAKMGAAIEAAIARISRQQIKPAVKELKSALRRMQAALDRQGRAVARRGSMPSGRGGGKVDGGPPMSPGEVKALRARLGMTQAEFARATGVTHVAVYFWESGRTKPAGQRLRRLHELAGEASGKAPKRAARGGRKKAAGRKATRRKK